MLLLALVCVICVSCGDNDSPADSGLPDLTGEGIMPPDLGNGIDSSWPGTESLGRPCDPLKTGTRCTGKTVCLDVGAEGEDGCNLTTGRGCGVCSLPGCNLEDIETPSIEDNCPIIERDGKTYRTVCTLVPVAAGDGEQSTMTFCLPQCMPRTDENPCEEILKHAGLACDPASILLNDQSEVCLYPACSKDHHCGNKNPVEPDSVCHEQTNICLTKGSELGVIGQACATSSECGANQFCFPERTDDEGAVQVEGGYCTLVGCKYFDPTNPDQGAFLQCPESSKCFLMGSAHAVSLCLAVGCNSKEPPASDGCRDDASEGQYDCIKLDQDEVCWLDLGG